MRRSTALLAKQGATIDSFSGGRLTLGLAVGGRPDDFEAVGADFSSRGRAFDQQLEEMTKVWDGETPVGPAPANGKRPGLLIGGSADVAYRRAAKYADGWTMGGGGPEDFKAGLEKLGEAWKAEGRDGEPRTMALFYFSLGDGAKDAAEKTLGDYYAFLGDYTQTIVDSAATDAETIKSYIGAFEQAGADEVICFPVSSDPAQVELLAEVVK